MLQNARKVPEHHTTSQTPSNALTVRYGSGSPGWYVPRYRSPRSLLIRLELSNISFVTTTSLSVQHYQKSTTQKWTLVHEKGLRDAKAFALVNPGSRLLSFSHRHRLSAFPSIVTSPSLFMEPKRGREREEMGVRVNVEVQGLDCC